MARWTADIDAQQFYLPTVAPEWAEPLRLAAQEHARAMAPASADQITHALMEMRSSTQIRNETAQEAEHSFVVLVRELEGTPLDIVREACRRYIRAERFFPRAPSELLAHSGPLLVQRQRRALNLARLADEAEAQRARAQELATAPPATLDDLRELIANPAVSNGVLATYVERGWASQALVDQALGESGTDPKAVPHD